MKSQLMNARTAVGFCGLAAPQCAGVQASRGVALLVSGFDVATVTSLRPKKSALIEQLDEQEPFRGA